MAEIFEIELVKSLSGRNQKHIKTANSLGLRKIGNITNQPKNKATEGKIQKIGYVLKVKKCIKSV